MRIMGKAPCPAPQPGRTRCERILQARSHLHSPLPGVCPRQQPARYGLGVMYKLLHLHSYLPSEHVEPMLTKINEKGIHLASAACVSYFSKAFHIAQEESQPRFITHPCTHSVQFSSVAQSCPTLCNSMNRSTPGLPVHHQLPEFTQTHIH